MTSTENPEVKFFQLKKCFQFTAHYSEQLISSFLFLIYASLRIFFIYEIFVVYKFTNDFLFGISIASELITILVWVLFIMLLTVKKDWTFQLHSAFKLNYWNYLYTNYLSESMSHMASHCSESQPRIIRRKAPGPFNDSSKSLSLDSCNESEKKSLSDLSDKEQR